ncbi:ABC transporter ATP-binding protein [bacterium]|nr:ABC transporter ATP-binding protein [bacterium]
MIELHDIWKIYRLGDLDVPVLKGISLSIGQRETVSLMGVSGSGKSTLMNILGCLDHPTSGQYLLEGRDVTKLSVNQRAELRNRKIGFVFQNFNLLARTSALDNVILPLEYHHNHISRNDSLDRAKMLLDRVGLKDRMHHHPSQLSGGQQQRVAIARALINQPSILFADEPTGNLDSRTSGEILEMFQQLNAEDGITILLVTHDPDVAHHARRVIHIRDGCVDGDLVGHATDARGGERT